MKKILIVFGVLFALILICNINSFAMQKTRDPINDEYAFRKRVLEDNNRIVERLDAIIVLENETLKRFDLILKAVTR